jgi:broad specificity phosphatase PhoE
VTVCGQEKKLNFQTQIPNLKPQTVNRILQTSNPEPLIMSSIYLVRHGITSANKENWFAGRTAEELHAEGIKQIRHVGERLRQTNIASVYCGPTRRTLQSAEIIGEMLDIPIYTQAELDEIYLPHWDGLTKDEIKQQYGAQYPTWLSAPETFELPGCETLTQVQKRALALVNRLKAADLDQNFLLVSHLIVLRCLVLYFKELALADFRSIKIDNGSIFQISDTENGSLSVRYF